MTNSTLQIPVTGNIFTRNRVRNYRDERRKRQIEDMLQEKQNSVSYIWDFKTQVDLEPSETETRALPRCCNHCLPTTDFMLLEEIKQYGLKDCLTIWKLNQNESFRNRKLPPWKELESDPKLLSLYPSEVQNSADSSVFDATKKQVLDVLSKLLVTPFPVAGFFVDSMIRVGAWLCRRYLSCYFTQVLVHEGHIHMLRDLQSQALPVIYIPTYRSSLDKAVIFWAMASNGLETPLFFPDDKANLTLSKYLGGIGTSLRISSENAEEDIKVCSALATYLRALISKRYSSGLMINLEVNRTRTGRPSAQIYGSEILRIIYDEFSSEKIEDAYFVPTSVSYETLPEDEEIFKMGGSGCGSRSRAKSSFLNMGFQILSDVFMPRKNKGLVRVDFQQPICIRELSKSLLKNPKVEAVNWDFQDSYGRTRDCSYLRWDSSDESAPSVSRIYGTLAPLYPAEEDRKLDSVVLDVTSHHLVYDAGKCESVMPTHLVAFLVMKHFKQGAYLEEFKTEMDKLLYILSDSKKDFGFYIGNCDIETIIARGVDLLSNDLNIEWDKQRKSYKITPKNGHENLRRLEYYANYIFPEFAMEAIISLALFSILGIRLTSLRGFDTELQVKDDLLLRHCKRIYEVFTFPFLLHPPCYSSEGAIRRAISQMSDIGLLTLKMRPHKRRYSDDEDSDDYFYSYGTSTTTTTTLDKPKLSYAAQEVPFIPEAVLFTTTEENVDRLDFHRKLLLPYLEIFGFLFRELKILLEVEGEVKRMEMSEFEQHLLQSLLKKMDDGDFSNFGEFINWETVKSFLSCCEDHLILYADLDDNTRYYVLDDKYVGDEGVGLDNHAADVLHYISV